MKYEIQKLATLLKQNNIPFELDTDVCGNKDNQIFYPSRENCICDAICHEYSYGGKDGLIEIMGLTENDDDVEGYLTAEDVFIRMYNNYYEIH